MRVVTAWKTLRIREKCLKDSRVGDTVSTILAATFLLAGIFTSRFTRWHANYLGSL